MIPICKDDVGVGGGEMNRSARQLGRLTVKIALVFLAVMVNCRYKPLLPSGETQPSEWSDN